MALNLSPIVFDTLGSGANIMEVPRDQAIQLVAKYTMQHDPYLNDNLYTLRSMGNTGTISFMNFIAPKHVFQPRLNACSWNPKGRFKTNQTKLDLHPVEVNMSQCPDAFYGGPWERIFGVGNKIADLQGTPEGQALLNELLRLVYAGIGNDIHNMVDSGDHPLITISDDNGYYPIEADEWADYTNQMLDSVVGFNTMIDGLKDQGLDHYNVDMSAYCNATTGNFTGDIFDFLNALIAGRTSEFKIAENQRGGSVKGIIQLDENTWQALQDQFLDRYTTIPAQFALFVDGVSGQLDISKYLKFKGYAVMPQTSWTEFDAINGVRTRRAVLSYPKVFGIGYDVPNLNEYGGVSLRVEQSPLMRDKGRIDMFGALKLGAVIIDTNFVVNASKVYLPPFAS
jgi:hypothetical protein